MKPASLALLVLAFVVAMAWPLSSAIGAAAARASSGPKVEATSCATDDGTAQTDDGDDDDGDDVALPPGHPSLGLQLPPGHPPISADGLPPGHPPIDGALPPGHPPIPSGHAPAIPTPIDAFGAPILLTI